MIALYFVLLLLAVIFFGLAGFRVAHPRVEFVALGLFFFTLVSLIQMFQKL